MDIQSNPSYGNTQFPTPRRDTAPHSTRAHGVLHSMGTCAASHPMGTHSAPHPRGTRTVPYPIETHTASKPTGRVSPTLGEHALFPAPREHTVSPIPQGHTVSPRHGNTHCPDLTGEYSVPDPSGPHSVADAMGHTVSPRPGSGGLPELLPRPHLRRGGVRREGRGQEGGAGPMAERGPAPPAPRAPPPPPCPRASKMPGQRRGGSRGPPVRTDTGPGGDGTGGAGPGGLPRAAGRYRHRGGMRHRVGEGMSRPTGRYWGGRKHRTGHRGPGAALPAGLQQVPGRRAAALFGSPCRLPPLPIASLACRVCLPAHPGTSRRLAGRPRWPVPARRFPRPSRFAGSRPAGGTAVRYRRSGYELAGSRLPARGYRDPAPTSSSPRRSPSSQVLRWTVSYPSRRPAPAPCPHSSSGRFMVPGCRCRRASAGPVLP